MIWRPALVGSLLAAALVLPIPASLPVAPRSPLSAARLAEAAGGPMELAWGKLRGWRWAEGAWLLIWQPAHGAWAVRARVADAGDGVEWRVQAAPWLPGVRLSEALAREVAGVGDQGHAQSLERPARRDWDFAGLRVAGGLPAGRDWVEPPPARLGVWPAALLGAVLVGALCLHLLPGPTTHRFTVALAAGLAALLAVSPSIMALAYGSFRPGVRPWVAQLAWLAAMGVVCVAVLAFAARFGVLGGRPKPVELAVAAALGLLAGRLAPVEPMVAVAGLTARGVVWLAAALGLGYLAAVAAVGLRELLHPVRRLRLLVLAGLGSLAVASAGGWLGIVTAVLVAAAVPRPRAVWTAVTAVGFWIVGGTLASCGWPEPLRDGVVLLLVGSGALTTAALVDGSPRATIAPCGCPPS